jgi:hypothetical protein
MLTLVILCLGSIPTISFAIAQISVGVQSQPIWFSREPFFAGDQVTINVQVYNSSTSTWKGVMELRNGSSSIDARPFTLKPGGSSATIAFPWTAVEGDHKFSVAFLSSELISIEDNQSTMLSQVEKTGEITRSVDRDTDTDGLGDLVDTDDDGDGLFDKNEIKLKTDPRNKDTDNDGILDGVDKEPLVMNAPSFATDTAAILPADAVMATSVKEAIAGALPEDISKRAIPIIGKMEQLRLNESDRAKRSADFYAARLDVATTTGTTTITGIEPDGSSWDVFKEGVSTSKVFRSPLEYALLFILLVWGYVTGNAYVFYAFLLILMFQVLRLIYGLIFD